MEPPGGRDSRFNLGYSMNLLSGETPPEIYGNPNLGRPSTSLQQLSPRHTMVSSACNRGIKSDLYDDRGMSSQGMGLDNCVNDISEDTYSMQSKKSPPSNGKKTKGRVKIKMEYIENKLRRYTTFSKRKTGIMKKVCWDTNIITSFTCGHSFWRMHVWRCARKGTAALRCDVAKSTWGKAGST
ncbi:unnamed protein product [Phaedon cochleariae]|uniref:MADS-box domain-containing protein n=1 Tax=Phaedon cochleariae TaxID=80249 RepID=A0A9N9X4E9_PHACE|nr:unnamed protein product [Phaedon cochleariae]